MEEGLRPARIGAYPILDELGRGGMGVVYVAEDPRLRRQVALKVLPREFSEDETALQRFRQEAQFLAALNHPNIATIHTLEEADGAHFLTMELVPGQTLDRLLLGNPLPLERALAVAQQIAKALEAAHKSGVVHRDLKPLNIMLSPDGDVKVLDFGLAKNFASSLNDETIVDSRTQPGVIVGSPGYMSPEQVRGEEVDHRTDVWAFGCILFECLTGQHMFPGKSHLDRVVAILEHDPDWSALPGDTPESVRDLLMRCSRKDVNARLGSMIEVRRAIEEEIASRTIPTSVTPSAPAQRAPNNLPVQLTRFVGREDHLAKVAERLVTDRLVTLAGSGGCGKTRLALQVAGDCLERFPDGAWFVELAPVSHSDRLAQAVASALDVVDQPNQPLDKTLVDALSSKHTLLVFDNCEHVLEGCARLVDTLLKACPALHILVTSREVLGIVGESVHHVPALTVPKETDATSLDALEENESVRLFLERAMNVNASFSLTSQNAGAVVQICRHLDGIPLALELAAARVKALDVNEVASRLNDRFRLLTVGSRTSLPHHQTLRALIDWSHDHLGEAERRLFRRLSVFAAGWTFPAAEAVCEGNGLEAWEVLDHLSRLVDKSLVEVDADESRAPDGRARYRMLETVRQYARDRLEESQERATTEVRHRDYFLSLATDAETRLTGPEQATWFRRLASDHDNLHLAIDISVARNERTEACRLVAALGRYWMVTGHWNEGLGICRELTESERDGSPDAHVGAVLRWAGSLANSQGAYPEARAFFERSLTSYRGADDKPGIATVLASLGALASNQGDYVRARELHEESLRLRRELDDRFGIADSLKNLGAVATNQLRFEDATRFYEESLAILRELNDRRAVAVLLYYLGEVTANQGRYENSNAYFEECLPLARQVGDRRLVAFALHGLGVATLRDGDVARARAYFEMSVVIRQEMKDRAGVAESLEAFASLAIAKEDWPRAARLLAVVSAEHDSMGIAMPEYLDRLVADTKAHLPAETFGAEWTRGTKTDPADAIEFALNLDA